VIFHRFNSTTERGELQLLTNTAYMLYNINIKDSRRKEMNTIQADMEGIAQRTQSDKGYQPKPIEIVEVQSIIPTMRFGDLWRQAG